MVDRRTVLTGALAGSALGAVGGWRSALAAAARRDPFTLGVASGYPTPGSVVLWTRLAPEPLAPGGGLPPLPIEVEWEIAADPAFRQIVRRGRDWAHPDWGFSVHAEVFGLEPARDYWYRFLAAGARSPAGRTRTADAPGASALRIAVTSCQNYEQGHYAALAHVAARAPDLVLHLGDYIYERGEALTGVRRHGSSECYDLEDYRRRYALYKSDPSLAAAHAAAPWIVMWDDHEVDSDYAGDQSEERDEPALFLQRRAAAYRAFYENLPLPRRALPYGAWMRLHAQRAFGDLVNLLVLDQRQYRSPQACPQPHRAGGQRVTDCAELDREDRTMLGGLQEEWLRGQLGASRARWNLLAQGTVMSRMDELPGPETRFWTDAWSGYPAARRRFTRTLQDTRASNPVVLSGDIHAFIVGGLHERPDDPDSALLAPEFVTTSLTSNGPPQAAIDNWLAANPSLRLADSRHRGYLQLDLSPERLRAGLVVVDDVADPRSACREQRAYVVEAGAPTIHEA